MIRKLLRAIVQPDANDAEAKLYRDLIRHEARIGGTLFGEVPKDHRREFFCLDERTWIWHEEWLDNKGQRQVRTTRYDVRPDTILKAQNGQPYRPVSAQEAQHLYQAAQLYNQRMRSDLYAFV